MGVDLKASDKIELKTCDTQKPYVFVSYSKQDKDVVYACVAQLQSRGCNIWIDKEQLVNTVGECWNKEARKVLRAPNCKAILFFMSKYSMWSAPVCAELNYAKSTAVRQNNCGEELKRIPINISDWVPSSKCPFSKWVYAGSVHTDDEAGEELDNNDKQILLDGLVEKKVVEGGDILVEKRDIAKYIWRDIIEEKNADKITFCTAEEIDTIIKNIPEEAYNGTTLNANASVNIAAAQTVKTESTLAPAETTTGKSEATKSSAKKTSSVTGDIAFTLYNKAYTMNQSDMMLLFFGQVLKRHLEVIHDLDTYKGMNCVSKVNYEQPENRTEEMPSYFRVCRYFTFENGESLSVGTAYGINDKLKKMALLLNICGESPEVFSSEQVELPATKKSAEKGDSSRGNSSYVSFTLFGEKFSQNQTDMLGTICSTLLEKHPDKLTEAADALLCIDLKDYSNVAREERPVYFSSMNQYQEGTTPYCVGGGFGMKEKLKMVAKLIQICGEDPQCFAIEGQELPAATTRKASAKKTADDFLA